MEEYPTPSNQVEIDAEKLKFYNSQLKVWKYAKNSAAEFQKHSFDYRSSILKKILCRVSSGKSKSVSVCKGKR